MKVKVAVAGKKLAAMAKEANGYGLLRIRADLKHGRDPRGVGLEHAAHADERAAAIDHVLATGTPGRRFCRSGAVLRLRAKQRAGVRANEASD